MGHWVGTSARVCSTLLATALLGACAQAVPSAACGPDLAPDGRSLRVLIGFVQPVDLASEPVLRQLQSFSRGCVLPTASVSARLHVYQFTGVEGLEPLRQRLLAWPMVQSVTPDVRVPPRSAP